MRQPVSGWVRPLAAGTFLLLASLRPGIVRAVPACGPGADDASARSAAGWPAPLDRTVSLRLREVPLRAALDRLAAAARLRFSYNDELLPLDRRVCASFHGVAVGDVLLRLIGDAAVAPVAVGADHVILVPAPAGDTLPAPAHVVKLDQLIVDGGTAGGDGRALPATPAVVSRPALDADPGGSVAQAMNGAVPGVWVWEPSPGSVLAGWSSMRGASTFGTAAPKVYLDGIELANPLLFSRLSPDAVERIEVMRGPQGAALYGADALDGVVSIVSRTEHLDQGTPRTRLQSVMGRSESTFAAGGTLTQEHALGLRTGSDVRYAGLDVTGGGIGAFTPGAYNRHLVLNGNARLVGPRTILTATARVFGEDAGTAMSPLLRAAGWPSAAPSYSMRYPGEAARDSAAGAQSVREYTVGTTLSFLQNSRWTHALVAGLDGYRLGGTFAPSAPVPSAAEAALSAARGDAARGTLRFSSVGRFGDPARAATTLTLAGEQSVLRTRATPDPGASPAWLRDSLRTAADWQSSSALVAQAQTGLRDALFLTGGLRLQHDAGLGGAHTELLPVLGTALVRDAGPLTIKLRAAYGRGMRPPQTRPGETLGPGAHGPAAKLQPEQQSGVEAGVDVSVDRALTLQLTRYDQRAFGLVQRVAAIGPNAPLALPVEGGFNPQDASSGGATPRTPASGLRYSLENVGAIANRGWELQASTGFSRLALSGTLSYTDSRVAAVAGGYSGELRPGDRLLEVPAWTGSLAGTWSAPGWTAAVMGYRAYDWVDYDRLALARDLAGGAARLWGQDRTDHLRSYWRHYGGYNHLNASASRVLRRGLTLVATGDNLLNVQVGEPDNTTITPGRTISLGIRASF